MIAERGLVVLLEAGIFMGEFYLTLATLWLVLIGLAVLIVGRCILRLTKGSLSRRCWHLPPPALKRRFGHTEAARAVRCLQ